MKTARAVQVTANPQSLVRAMGFAFANHLAVVSELAQNAHRAGATQITINYDADARVLVVDDDGQGIGDWTKLLAMAESGWDETVRANATPYGLGFFSAVMTAEVLLVESRDLRLHASTADLRAIKLVALEPIPMRVGTRIELRGFTAALSNDWVQHTFRGFPVPVTFNDKAVVRDRAIDAPLAWIETSVGQLFLEVDEESLTPVRVREKVLTDDTTIYLQGFRISGMARSHRPPNIVHLDPRRFFGKLPDRDHLIDEDKVIAEVLDALRSSIQQKLKQWRAAMAPTDFVRDHAGNCCRWGCPELLNDIPFLPGRWVSRFTGQPCKPRYAGDDTGLQDYTAESAPVCREPGLVHQDEIPAQLLPSDFAECNEEDMSYPLYAWASGATIFDVPLRNPLHEDHWVLQRVVAPFEEGDLTVELGAEQASREGTDIDNWWGTLTIVESIHLSGILGRFELDRAAGIEKDETLYVTPDASSDVVRLVNDFSVDDDYDEEAEDNARDAFRRFHGLLVGRAAATVMENLLNERVRNSVPNEFYGKTFTVSIGEHGDLNVVEN